MKCTQVKPGEWVQPRRKNYIMQCCDCGLLHRMNFRIVRDKRGRNFIQFQAFRATHKEARALVAK
jgi:Zn-finger protein